MRYMTKQWYETMQKADFYLDLKVSKKAEGFSEAYFKELYKTQEYNWLAVQEEISALGFEDEYPKEFPAERFFSDLLVLPAEYEAAKAEYLQCRAEEEKRFVPSPVFDEAEEKRRFRSMYRQNKRLLETALPKEILDKVADVRVLALQHTTSDIKKEITAYCRRNMRAVESAQKAYWKQYRKNFRKEEPAFAERFSFHDCTVLSCRRKGKDLVLRLDNSGGFTEIKQVCLRNCTVLVQDKPLAGAWWLYEELYPTAEGFEIHVLLQKDQLIDFIVKVSDVDLM